MLYELIFFPRIVTDPCDCILAHTTAVAQQLGIDTPAKIHSHASVMGMCVLEKMSLKRAWSKLCSIRAPDLHVPDMLK